MVQNLLFSEAFQRNFFVFRELVKPLFDSRFDFCLDLWGNVFPEIIYFCFYKDVLTDFFRSPFPKLFLFRSINTKSKEIL